MFTRFFTVTTLVALALSTPVARRDGQCNTGSIQCCDGSTTTAKYNEFAKGTGLAQILADVDATLGLSCSPISAFGNGSGAKCTQQPMCCSNNTYYGFINVGCTPINLDL